MILTSDLTLASYVCFIVLTRFEAEIASNTTPIGVLPQSRHIIGSNTFDLMQKKLENVGKGKVDMPLVDPLTVSQDGITVPMSVPPPPPPPVAALSSNFPGIIPPMTAFTGIPPPPPPPPFMIPHHVKSPKGKLFL